MSQHYDHLTVKFIIKFDQHQYVIMKINNIEVVMAPILRYMLEAHNELFSLTMSHDETSLVTTRERAMKITAMSENAAVSPDIIYNIITFDTDVPSLMLCGVLERIIRKFACKQIAIVTMSTYEKNYIMFNSNDLDRVKELVSDDRDFIA